MDGLVDFFEHVVKELTPTGPGNERPIAALQENDNVGMTLLHALSGADKKPQLETKTHKLPVVWTNSSVSSPRMIVRSVIPLAFKECNIAVVKSGQIIEVDDNSRRVSLNNGKKIVQYSDGGSFCICISRVAVDSDGRIWMCDTDSHHILCINDEGQLLGVKKFSENTFLCFIAFLGERLVVIEYERIHRNNHINSYYYSDYRLTFYTSRFDEEEPMKVIRIGQKSVSDLKTCDRTRVIYLVQGIKIRAVTPDSNVHDVNLNSGEELLIVRMALTVNGEIIACDSTNRVLRYTLVGDGIVDFTYRLIDQFRFLLKISHIVTLPNQQVALVENYIQRMVVLDV